MNSKARDGRVDFKDHSDAIAAAVAKGKGSRVLQAPSGRYQVAAPEQVDELVAAGFNVIVKIGFSGWPLYRVIIEGGRAVWVTVPED